MKVAYDNTLVILFLFAVIIQTSLQFFITPGQGLNIHQHNVIEASNRTLRPDKNNKLVIPTLQTDIMFHVLEQWENVSSLCNKTIEEFGESSAQLISCYVNNARPITVCQNCVEKHIEFYGIYKNICVSTGNEQPCHDQLLNRDKLNVISKTCDFASSIWTNAYCANCYENEDDSVLSNETLGFLKLSKAVDECFQDASSVGDNIPVSKNRSICSTCSKVYNSLLEDYQKLKHRYKDSVCMDLTDIMNTTSNLWNEYYHCTMTNTTESSVYILASIFSLLVALFYSGYRFIAHAQNTKIIGQKRKHSRGKGFIKSLNSFNTSNRH